MVDKSFWRKRAGEGGCERLRVSVIMICARCCSKRRRAFGFIMSSLREAFVSGLRVDVMKQASGSFMTGIRAFSAHLLLTSLSWPSTYISSVLCLLSGEYRCSYFPDYVEDIYDGGPLCPV